MEISSLFSRERALRAFSSVRKSLMRESYRLIFNNYEFLMLSSAFRAHLTCTRTLARARARALQAFVK